MLSRTLSRLPLNVFTLLVAAQTDARAADIVVNVSGIGEARGSIGCAQ